MSLWPVSTQLSHNKYQTPSPNLAFGNVPLWAKFEQHIAKDQLLNRTIIGTIGNTMWAVMLARNHYERVEKILGWSSWLLMALMLPVASLKVTQAGLNQLKKQFGIQTKEALEIPLANLDTKRALNKTFLMRTLKLNQTAQVKKAAEVILRYKTAIIGTNLLMLALLGQGFYWGKNWVTEKLSGRKGFTGEFTYAHEQYTKKQVSESSKSEKIRFLSSLGIGAIGVLGIPLFIYTVSKNGSAALKKSLPYFDFKNSIYMGKAVLLCHRFFNWALPNFLAARDKHELREAVIASAVSTYFYLAGDDLIAGLSSRHFQSKYKAALKDYSIVQPQKGLFGIPKAKSFSQVYLDVEKKLAPKIALKLARMNFWLGILGTSIGLGISMTLINNWYTHKRVTEEQKAMNLHVPNKFFTGQRELRPFYAAQPKQGIGAPGLSPLHLRQQQKPLA